MFLLALRAASFRSDLSFARSLSLAATPRYSLALSTPHAELPSGSSTTQPASATYVHTTSFCTSHG
eukprot:3702319-Heterocapsa_arctica.AAC.1